MGFKEQFYNYIHSNYTEDVRNELLTELDLVRDQLIRTDLTKLSPDNKDNILKILTQDPLNRNGIILGMDPYPYNATGIPFESIDNNHQSNHNLASNIRRIYNLPKESYNHCQLHNLIDSDNLLLLNAALTVPKPVKGGKSNSGAHYNIWQNFMRILLGYILRKSNPVFILIFGKDVHLLELSKKCIAEAQVDTIPIVSYHPCMACYFLSEKCNPFQEINALLRLYDKPIIKWYKVFDILYEVDDIKEVRVFEDNLSFYHLNDTLKFPVCELTDYHAVLGDVQRGIIQKIEDNKLVVAELGKLYEKSFASFSIKLNNIISTIATEVDPSAVMYKLALFNMMPDAILSLVYQNNKAYVRIKCIDNYIIYRLHPIEYYLHAKFGSKNFIRTFNLSVDDEDMIKLNAYETVIAIISSVSIDYCCIELIHHLMNKLTTTASYEKIIDVTEIHDKITEKITLTGLKFKSIGDLNIANFTHAGMAPVITNLNNVIILRNLTYLSYAKKMNQLDSRGPSSPIFNVYLYLTEDYQESYVRTYSFRGTKKDMLNEIELYKKTRTDKQISYFHISIAICSSITPRAMINLTEDLRYNQETEDVLSESLNSNYYEALEEEKRLLNIVSIAEDKSSVTRKLESVRKNISKLEGAVKVIDQLNKIIRYLKANGSNI